MAEFWATYEFEEIAHRHILLFKCIGERPTLMVDLQYPPSNAGQCHLEDHDSVLRGILDRGGLVDIEVHCVVVVLAVIHGVCILPCAGRGGGGSGRKSRGWKSRGRKNRESSKGWRGLLDNWRGKDLD